MDNFVILEEIYQTQSSTILKCKNKTTKDIVILKQILQKKYEEAPSKEVLRELLVLMNFNHPNILKFYSVFAYKTYVVIEMEFCVSSLSSLIRQISKPLHLAQIKKITKSIGEGLKHLHYNDIIHRDIKPGNVLINENCIVKLGDFGSSRISTDLKQYTPQIGTKWYKAPEMFFNKCDYDKSVDIWSFGCLIAELFLLEPLFPGSTDFEMINMIFSFLGYNKQDEDFLQPKMEFNHVIAPYNIFGETFDSADIDAIDLLKKMLIVNSKERITIEEILKHPFLRDEDSYMDVNLPI